MISRLDGRLAAHQARKDEAAQAEAARAKQQEVVEAHAAALRAFAETPAFAYVREVLDPLMIHAVEGCLKGQGEERIKAQGEYDVIEKFLRAFGRGVAHGIGWLQDVQVRQPGSEEAESLPPGPSA